MRESNGPCRVITWIPTGGGKRTRIWIWTWNRTDVHSNQRMWIEWTVGCMGRKTP